MPSKEHHLTPKPNMHDQFIDEQAGYLETAVANNDYGLFHTRLAYELTVNLAMMVLVRLVWRLLRRVEERFPR